MRKFVVVAAILLASITAQAEWEISINTDEMTDQTHAMIYTLAIDKKRPLVAIKCESNAILFVADFGDYFADGGNFLLFRIDSEPVFQRNMMKYPGISSALFHELHEIPGLLEGMKRGTKLTLRATPYRETPMTFSVSLVGFTKAYNQCKKYTVPVSRDVANLSQPIKESQVLSAEVELDDQSSENGTNENYNPIRTVAPIYPARALSRGIEGYVDLEFTVTSQGTVRDPRVVFSTDKVFDRAAIRAVGKFKYEARGHETEGVTTRISFAMN